MHVDVTRAILALSGEDRSHFLQGLITQDISHLRNERGLFAALLSPQGKILHDFFLLPHADEILLDTDSASKESLIKRLNMYRLRAKVAIRDASSEWQVAYRTHAAHAAVGHITQKKSCTVMTDPRAAELGERLYMKPDTDVINTVAPEVYHAHRMRLGIPDGARDVAEDVALDAGYDLLGAVSYTKGCFVGQEVTARMYYKQIARRGFYVVEAAHALPPSGTAITAAGIAVGTMRGSQDSIGLAMLKFDEVESAQEKKTPILVDNLAVRVHCPAWMQPKLAQFRAARENQ